MSKASKFTLLGSSLVAASTILIVHFQQKAEKAVRSLAPSIPTHSQFPVSQTNRPGNEKQAMHQGVIRDAEQRRIKLERQLDFDMQKELEEEYKKGQTVRDTTADDDDVPDGGAKR